jgi:putative membrane protein
MLLVVTASTLVACRGKESYGATDSGAAAGRMSAAPAAANTTSTAGAPSAGASSLNDANIVYILDQANAADSARGRLAETKGTSPDVKSFGQLMVGEHHALRAQGQTLAKRLGVTPEMPAGDRSTAQAKQEMDSLTATPRGKAWDRAYVDYEVGYHQQVLETATAALGAAQNPQLKALIKQAAPVIQHHLERAQQIQKKLGPGATT